MGQPTRIQLVDNLTTGMLVLCVAELHHPWIDIRTWEQELQTAQNGNTGAFFCRCRMVETLCGRLIWIDGGITPEWGFGGRQNGFEERKPESWEEVSEWNCLWEAGRPVQTEFKWQHDSLVCSRRQWQHADGYFLHQCVFVFHTKYT